MVFANINDDRPVANLVRLKGAGRVESNRGGRRNCGVCRGISRLFFFFGGRAVCAWWGRRALGSARRVQLRPQRGKSGALGDAAEFADVAADKCLANALSVLAQTARGRRRGTITPYRNPVCVLRRIPSGYCGYSWPFPIKKSTPQPANHKPPPMAELLKQLEALQSKKRERQAACGSLALGEAIRETKDALKELDRRIAMLSWAVAQNDGGLSIVSIGVPPSAVSSSFKLTRFI